mmetsp:Transcript_42656/g.74940  ORF Transcript_42656/g.74940 Transcript_42656/m.74940 type:complete len:120 (+) Transcript_42656:135-494(+)
MDVDTGRPGAFDRPAHGGYPEPPSWRQESNWQLTNALLRGISRVINRPPAEHEMDVDCGTTGFAPMRSVVSMMKRQLSVPALASMEDVDPNYNGWPSKRFCFGLLRPSGQKRVYEGTGW